ncbi:putative small secreted protein [Sphingomonas sp. BE138]|nr:entericidin A/B family lipoprotein [Sphingomonas sp. BE138]MDR6786724.1 putative small secreted protein [Sphingomonas sp. BE138]
MNRKIALTSAALAMLALSACNTVNGVGKDVKSAGTAVEDASGKNKK